jgi:XTP/dITP diphosphohydrolase
MDICFATNNKHKLEEVAQMLPSSIKLLTLSEIGCNEDIPETKDEVEILNGEPGVKSARYAGEPSNSRKYSKITQKFGR